jgi:DNA-binding MarR family transcriptional regulator
MEYIGQLLIKLHKAHRATIASRLVILNMYPGQEGLLYYLSQNDGLTMSELVEKLEIKHPTLFTMIDRMAKAGLIKKDKDKTDKRTSRIFLTNLGKQQLKELSKIWLDIEALLAKDFNEEEKTILKTGINKLINNLLNG